MDQRTQTAMLVGIGLLVGLVLASTQVAGFVPFVFVVVLAYPLVMYLLMGGRWGGHGHDHGARR